MILQELLQGFRGPKQQGKIIESFASLPLIIPDRMDHIDAAALKIRLCRKGVQAGTIEVLLAQLCIRHGLSMLSSDKDFARMARFVPLGIV